MTPPLFVVGCPRSGTTLVAELLADSPWGSPVESHFITKYYGRLGRYLPLDDPSRFASLVRSILSERPVLQWGLELSPEDLYKRMTEWSYAAIVDAICRERSRNKGKISWGDKTPHYVRNLSELAGLFPGAHFVNVVRDGRDVALSLLERPWGPKNVFCCAELWVESVGHRPTIGRLREQGRYHELRYEDLLAQPEETLEALFHFLGQPLPAGAVSRVSLIDRRNSRKWPSKMSNRDLRIFEAVAGRELCRFGYPVDTDSAAHIKPIARAFYRSHNFVRWSGFMFRQNVVDGIRMHSLGKEPFAE